MQNNTTQYYTEIDIPEQKLVGTINCNDPFKDYKTSMQYIYAMVWSVGEFNGYYVKAFENATKLKDYCEMRGLDYDFDLGLECWQIFE